MANLLLINPMHNCAKLVEHTSLPGDSILHYTIVVTGKSIIKQDIDLSKFSNIHVLDLKSTEWNFDLKFDSAIAFDLGGQTLLESVNSQINLGNPGTPDNRLDKFFSNPLTDGDIIIETISYQGRHAVVSGWNLLKDNHVSLITNFDSAWFDRIEELFEILDNSKIINGPVQAYFDSNNKFKGIKLHPSNIGYTKQKQGTSRHWFDIWPTVTTLHAGKPAVTQTKFYNWLDNTGTARTYHAKELTI